jgi:branched-chain amino acid transport system substrate-binding protein
MENLEMTEAKMAALGLPNFGPEFKVSCANHGGDGLGAVAQWDAKAKTWSLITDYFPADDEVLNPLIIEDSTAFAQENNITPGCN